MIKLTLWAGRFWWWQRQAYSGTFNTIEEATRAARIEKAKWSAKSSCWHYSVTENGVNVAGEWGGDPDPTLVRR